MKKRIWIGFVIALVAIAGYFLYRATLMSQREHQIFCETLIPGMSQDEVLDALRKFGEISYSTPPSFGNIAVGYIDPRIVGQKTYILSFHNEKYSGASVIAGFWESKGIGSVNAVCDP